MTVRIHEFFMFELEYIKYYTFLSYLTNFYEFKLIFIFRGVGPGGVWGGRTPPGIGDLYSKNTFFNNFLLIRTPPAKNFFPRPCLYLIFFQLSVPQPQPYLLHLNKLLTSFLFPGMGLQIISCLQSEKKSSYLTRYYLFLLPHF